jgi:hypothetical protein
MVGVLAFAAGCSAEKPAAPAQGKADALKKEADAQKKMRDAEAGNK